VADAVGSATVRPASSRSGRRETKMMLSTGPALPMHSPRSTPYSRE